MKTLATILFFATSALAQDQKTGFRDAGWGTTREQVKRTEQNELISEDNKILMYAGKLLGMPATIGYIFIDNQLVRGKYLVEQPHTNKNDYISDFQKFKESLTRKYGSPSVDKEYWSDELYRGDQSQYGMAVSVGHLIYQAAWERDAVTHIRLSLHGDNFDITLSIEYQSVAHLELEQKAREQAEDDEL